MSRYVFKSTISVLHIVVNVSVVEGTQEWHMSMSTNVVLLSLVFPLETGRKKNAYETFGRHPERLLNVLCPFNLRPDSREIALNTNYKFSMNMQRSLQTSSLRGISILVFGSNDVLHTSWIDVLFGFSFRYFLSWNR